MRLKRQLNVHTRFEEKLHRAETSQMLSNMAVGKVLLLASIWVKYSLGFLDIGRIPPAEFDIYHLNGYYTQNEAVQVCESSPICAGFTYRGLVDNSYFKHKKYFMHFVTFVHVSTHYYTNFKHNAKVMFRP